MPLEVIPIENPAEYNKDGFFTEWIRSRGLFDKRSFGIVTCSTNDLDHVSTVYKPCDTPDHLQHNQLIYKVYLDKWYCDLIEDLEKILYPSGTSTFDLHIVGDYRGEIFDDDTLPKHPQYTFHIVDGKLSNIFTTSVEEGMGKDTIWESCSLHFISD